jgi:hypothetical protein
MSPVFNRRQRGELGVTLPWRGRVGEIVVACDDRRAGVG